MPDAAVTEPAAARPQPPKGPVARLEDTRGFAPEGFFDAFGALVADLRVLLWALALVCVGLAVSQYRMATESPVQSYLVEVDAAGRASVSAAQPVTGDQALEDRVVEAELRQLVIDMRTVFPAKDGDAVRQRLAEATYVHLQGVAVDRYNRWIRDPEEDPRLLGEHSIRWIQVEAVVLLDRLEAGAARWLVEWREETGPLEGYGRSEVRRLRGVFTVERASLEGLGATARSELLARNPLALVVPRFEINDVTLGDDDDA